MYQFSINSKAKLRTCDERLQKLFNEVVEHIDCTIIEGRRTDQDQQKAYNEGKSHLKPGQSKHNNKVSLAVDVAPYPIDWEDLNRFYYFSGIVRGIAFARNIPIRWGGDWDNDNDLKDQKLMDLVHFEINE